ncbi:MAG TPA: nicotinate-nucleotide adenylyltransferase [Pirellulales bacterium]|nr:nicotinate-nucleotide adenylyltransferase [Pirellulales bacterium]
MRLGIFGGSFDPVHLGHLLLAESCREQARLDEVWFVPAARSPHKREGPAASPSQRIDMLRLATGGHEAFRVSTMEIDRGGVSYTVETLEAVHHEQPDAELFFLMGADSLADLPTWREPRRICDLAIPLIVRRAGAREPDYAVLTQLVSSERLEAIRAQRVEMPVIDLSASDLRRRAAAGQSLRYRTPRAVEKYIEAQKLYE